MENVPVIMACRRRTGALSTGSTRPCATERARARWGARGPQPRRTTRARPGRPRQRSAQAAAARRAERHRAGARRPCRGVARGCRPRWPLHRMHATSWTPSGHGTLPRSRRRGARGRGARRPGRARLAGDARGGGGDDEEGPVEAVVEGDGREERAADLVGVGHQEGRLAKVGDHQARVGDAAEGDLRARGAPLGARGPAVATGAAGGRAHARAPGQAAATPVCRLSEASGGSAAQQRSVVCASAEPACCRP
jgi:hypothetical protein